MEELKQKYSKYVDDIFESEFVHSITGEKLYCCYLKDGYTTLSGWTSINMMPLESIIFYLKEVECYDEYWKI